MISIIIRREFMERVTKKSFIITTLLMPILMLGLMFAPVLISQMSSSDTRNIVLIDEASAIAPMMQDISEAHFTLGDAAISPDSILASDNVDAVLIIPDNVMDSGSSIRLISKESSSISLEEAITSQVNEIIEQTRLKAYNIDNINDIISAVKSDISLQNVRYDSDGSSAESSTMLSYILGVALTFLLYMCLLLYGQMVMTSIIEEKNNRVLEIIVSSVSPARIMLGKICGIGLVAVTQIVIWGVIIAVASAFVMPSLMSPQISSDLAMAAQGVDPSQLSTDMDLLTAISTLGNTGYILQIFALLLLFLVGGFMLYAAIYAAIGSAVDNIQDASQFQSVIIFPIILGIIFGMQAASDPSSSLALWTSIIPFTSPMVMMARIPFGIPLWEIGVSLVVLYASFFIMVWLAAKIYRVGIFMYGKKPSFKEIVRWITYR